MFSRNCPNCEAEIIYKSKGALKTGEKNNSTCRKCTSKKTGFTQRYATKGSNTGENNPFYGKKHTEESKRKIIKDRDFSVYKTPEFRDKISRLNKGELNPMHGVKVYDIWVNKYGKEEADLRLEEYKKKQSENNSGSKNSMYGKPCPQKSGNGWNGWYNGLFFRSLRELSFMIFMDKNGFSYKSAENIRIKYIDYKGSERTYSPDYITDCGVIFEVKPERLHVLYDVQAKHIALKQYCIDNNLKCFLLDIDLLPIDELRVLLKHNIVTFTERTRKKYENSIYHEGTSIIG